MHRRKSSKPESPAGTPGAGPYGNHSPQMPQMSQSALSVPLMTRERNVEAVMMKPPTNGVYSSVALSASNLSLSSRDDTLVGHSTPGSVSSKYMLTPDPSKWGANVYLNVPEPDDNLHNPDPRRDRLGDGGGSIFNARGLGNLGCLLILALALTGLFAVYPITDSFLRKTETLGAYNLGGTNSSGQVPEIIGGFGLIDKDTPQSAYTHTSLEDGSEWDLVFSDEFNTDGRSFYPGDDPYWEAVDLHYWGTGNLEWYSPDQVTTNGGHLNITLEKARWRDLDYKGGMIASWNKFCFTGGYFVANVSLPGSSKVHGLWPAVWAMGNLGRAGFGASLEGMWPYTYACYEKDGGCFAVYGFEYKPGNEGYILWTNDNEPAWKLYAAGMGPDDNVKIGQRPVPQEPMYMIINLGISPQFGGVDFEHLTFPTSMLVDWVRVYQPKDHHNIGCDPPDFPTRDYINTYIDAYTNPNLTTWVDDYKQVVPKNRLVDQC
ncbi:beta-glucan synthesis-associated protein [Ceratobasidium sp. 423]|nr:beta-glucan synthesis-associated protein [Ceratobasidium sp. 423]